jgi:hypothetical protein
MAGSVINVELQNVTRVDKDIYFMRTTGGNMRIYGERIVANASSETKKIFRQSIQKNVYAIPPTTYDRTGALAGGVKSRGFSRGIAAGEVYIDPGITGKNGYFYPVSVEFGLSSKPAYFGRHYWARGKAEAVIAFRGMMAPYAKEIATKMLGR